MLFCPYRADFTFWFSPKSKHEEGISELKAASTSLGKATDRKLKSKNSPSCGRAQTALISKRFLSLFSGSLPEAVAAHQGATQK